MPKIEPTGPPCIVVQVRVPLRVDAELQSISSRDLVCRSSTIRRLLMIGLRHDRLAARATHTGEAI